MADLKAQVIEALKTVDDPDLKKDLVTLGMVKDVAVSGNDVKAVIELTTPACPLKKKIEDDCRGAISKVAGIGNIEIEMTARVQKGRVGEGKTPIDGIKNIIAVSSGKGGVGKSTTSVNLAVALSELGAKVAILDADIYGPSIPGMLGITGRPKVIDNRIIPMQVRGMHVMSMGFMVTEDTPLVWRGPMLHGVMKQLLREVAWGDRDYLVVDLPPGTGDVQLSLSQMVPVTGAVIVTTPQNVALLDVKKGVSMFKKIDMPIIGLVENMSYYLCPKCGARDEIFDHGGGEACAAEMGINFLGGVPLNSTIRKSMDQGTPIAGDPNSPFSEIYRNLASKVAQGISVLNASGGESKPFAVISPS